MKRNARLMWFALLAVLLSVPGLGGRASAQMLEEDITVPSKITTEEATEAVEETGGEVKKELMEEGELEKPEKELEQPEL